MCVFVCMRVCVHLHVCMCVFVLLLVTWHSTLGIERAGAMRGVTRVPQSSGLKPACGYLLHSSLPVLGVVHGSCVVALLCCCLVVVLPFEDRVLMIASQVKAFDDELAELRRSHSAAASAAAAQAAASSAAAAAVQAALHHEVSALKSQIEALHNQSDGNTALLDAKAQLQSTVAEIGAKNVALATVQQLALDLERESENLTSQLAAATAEGAAKDRTVVELRDGAAALEQQLAAVKVDLQSATDSANARDEALRNVQQVVADMEIEISGLKHDFAMFRKMMHGQGMSEQQLAQIRPRDVTNAEHMEIFSTICTLNELIISAREAAKQPAVDRDKLLQLEGVTRTLTD